jgi:hypothetical protein
MPAAPNRRLASVEIDRAEREEKRKLIGLRNPLRRVRS